MNLFVVAAALVAISSTACEYYLLISTYCSLTSARIFFFGVDKKVRVKFSYVR